jgi:hypothetical protein
MNTSGKIKKIAILQSNYIPWKGYFDIIRAVDEFIIYDDVQYTKNDWRNRNIIKTVNGIHWLTIPISVKGKFKQSIIDAKVSDPKWQEKHWKTICMAYSKAKYFNDYKDIFEELYLNCKDQYLSIINVKFISCINKILGINTEITSSSDYKISTGKNEKLIELCLQAKADEYISGPSAKNYIDTSQFEENKIKLNIIGYNGYKTYEQLFPPFKHEVSVIDLIFNTGTNAKNYMKSLS